MMVSDQMELFSPHRDARCIRGVVGTCLAPCATACSQAEYRNRIGAAVDFLTGRDVTILDRLQEEMQSAARSQRFELAARLRDAHEDLKGLAAFLQLLREVRGYSFVYRVRGHGSSENWYLIREGQIMGVEQGPRNSRSSGRCSEALDAVFPNDDGPRPPTAPEDLDVVLLVARWFRKHPGELEAVMSPEEARRRCGSRLDI
jgi:excinuclease ABC subunit C